MTREEIWKDFFKKVIVPVILIDILFYFGKNIFTQNGETNYFYIWLFCGVPFGIILNSNMTFNYRLLFQAFPAFYVWKILTYFLKSACIFALKGSKEVGKPLFSFKLPV